jgi:hypothetical protein
VDFSLNWFKKGYYKRWKWRGREIVMSGEIGREIIVEREKYEVCRTEKRKGFFFIVEREIKGLCFEWFWKEVKERGRRNKMREKGYEF